MADAAAAGPPRSENSRFASCRDGVNLEVGNRGRDSLMSGNECIIAQRGG